MAEAFPVTVYHNPACGTSRNVLAIIHAAGYQPQIVDYLAEGWTRETLGSLLALTGLRPAELLREKGTPAAALGLLEPETGEEAIIQAMLEHPVLVNRPIVVTPRGAALCRPSERVFDLLDRRPARFVKENGEVVTPEPR